MKATLVIEGKEFPIEINDPELQKLIAPPPKQTGYERTGEYQEYYCVFGNGEIGTCLENLTSHNDEYYAEANYYSSKVVASNNARADRLMRKLRRFAVEHREDDIDWDRRLGLSFIGFGIEHHDLIVCNVGWARYTGQIVFSSEEAAKLAIDTFRDELIWYFTEYKDSL